MERGSVMGMRVIVCNGFRFAVVFGKREEEKLGGTSDEQQQHLDKYFIMNESSLRFTGVAHSSFHRKNAVPQKGSEMNLTLGGIDLNNSGSVLVRAEKKLLTVLFPDGCAFTLKAETEEDVDEWKEALERALEAAPNASPGGGS
ncbi:unnamed protein product [Sphagnum jensenii]|uniref:PH domain-containing protein n=1 Tax=Sphagnum jensenii TaxID=128206 RepID=A0ABP1BAK2_9BRYO